MINVTRSFLPPLEEFEKELEKIWESRCLTNNGPYVKNLESELEKRFQVEKVKVVNNGTIAMQVALRALGISNCDVITTPFSFVATTSALLLEGCKPIFVDIDPNTYNIDASRIEAHITEDTKAILAVHVFGIPCNVEEIKKVAKKHNLKVIYDGAHCFDVGIEGRSIFNYGHIATGSFHATKLYHTFEGGCIVTNDRALYEKIDLFTRFGIEGDNHLCLGTNAKISEINAAMGLLNLKYIDGLIEERKELSDLYDACLKTLVVRPEIAPNINYNYAYYPIVLSSEEELLKIIERLKAENINPRRYFYPSLNTLPYLKTTQECKISEDISSRILCLPLFNGLKKEEALKIAEIVKGVIL